jgi:hypothetical protein
MQVKNHVLFRNFSYVRENITSELTEEHTLTTNTAEKLAG